MPDAFGNPYIGETAKTRRYGRTLLLISLVGAILAVIAAGLAGGIETLVGGLMVFVVALVVIRLLIGSRGRFALGEALLELVVYAVVAVLFDGLFNRFGKLVGLISLLIGA